MSKHRTRLGGAVARQRALPALGALLIMAAACSGLGGENGPLAVVPDQSRNGTSPLATDSQEGGAARAANPGPAASHPGAQGIPEIGDRGAASRSSAQEVPPLMDPGAPASETDPFMDGPANPSPMGSAPANLNADPCVSAPVPLAGLSPEDRRRVWREPLPQTAVWNPPGPKRVGLQAGHWLVEQVPYELRGLQGGAVGGGKQEWEVNLDLAQRTKVLLEAAGVQVDLLPTTIPPRYQAHAFVAIHADGDTAGRLRGFKIARPGFSSVPAADDRLVDDLNAAYAAATGFARQDDQISMRMRYYYAFNSRRYCHAVAPGVPQAIVETGFLTNAADRVLLLDQPDVPARGMAAGILRFLNENRGAGRP